MSSYLRRSIAILAVVTFAGCGGDQYDRSVVSGNVTYAGKPIEQGQIRFVAIEDTKTPAAGAQIIDGTYRADHKGGVPSGKYRVEFLMFQPHDQSGAVMEGTVRQMLPDKFNKRSTITLTVPPGGNPITRDYDLE